MLSANLVGVGAGSQGEVFGAHVLKRTQLLPPLVQREVAFSQENDGGIVIVSLRFRKFLIVHFLLYDKKRTKEAYKGSTP